jgi:hypothetical protein
MIHVSFGMLFLLRGHDEIYALLNLLINMGTGIFILIYLYRDMYNSFYEGKTSLNQMIPIHIFSFFCVKSLIFIIGSMLVWVTSLIEVFWSHGGLYQLRIVYSAHPFLGVMYMIISKFVSVICEVGLIGLGIALSSLILNRKMALSVQWIIPVGVCLLLFAVMQLYVSDPNAWMIGTTSIQNYKQYAGFLAVNFESGSVNTDIFETVQWESIGLNGGVALLSYGLIFFIFNSGKYEVHGEKGDA